MGSQSLGYLAKPLVALMTPFQQAFDPINIIQFAGVNEEVPKSRRHSIYILGQ